MNRKDKYMARWGQLNTQYSYWRQFYKEVSEYIWPTGGVYDSEKPSHASPRKYNSILKDSGEYANKILGAGMQGGLSSPSRSWYRFGLMDKELEEFGPVKTWLSTAEKITRAIFNRSNFYASSHMGYEEQGAFGTECLLMEEHPVDVVRFYPITCGQYRIASGADGRVDTIFRECQFTAIQMVEKFGANKVSKEVKRQAEERPFTYVTVMHVIEPRHHRDINKKDSLNMPWASVWFEKRAKETILRESGFEMFPGAVPRWSLRGSTPYGFGPGHGTLGAVKMVNELEKSGLKGLHQMVEPALVVPRKYRGVIDMTPAALNPADSGEDIAIRRLFEVNLPLRDLEAKVDAISRNIERAFYNDMFLLISNLDRRDITATEILERKEEKLLMLGPTIERQIKEKLDPCVDFVFKTALKRGIIPPPPEELQGMSLKVEYVSVLAQAQKLIDAQSLRAYRDEVGWAASLNPSTLHKTDLFEYLEQYGDAVGVAPKIIRPQEDVEEVLQQEQAMAQQAQEQAQAVETVKALGSASTEEGTALGEVKKSLGV